MFQSFNYAHYLFYTKRFKTEINCFCIRTRHMSVYTVCTPYTAITHCTVTSRNTVKGVKREVVNF